ncbi:MAG: DUF4232 domain-containing protein [Nocardioidaceae bacterium]
MSVSTRSWAAALAVLALGTTTLTTTPATASTGSVPACVAAHLSLVRGSRDMATSHRFDHVRITNTGSSPCRLFGYPTFRFRNGAGTPIGWTSTPAGLPAHVVVLDPGTYTRTTVGTVVPAVTLPAQCHARTARSVDVRLAYRPHVYHVPITIRVCTTKLYRPTSYPVGF